ncbi:ATP-binding protein [Accumulibacter sp.]|uniref:sensor histidine kinase n=1 Tax=Accumulibacter sp. TaxID=2053492 RepID=UPI001AC1A0E5|nr:ATP-binding protein [Accumulibacter sp.]MBN8455128.1 sensor histidine kinase [Accumulibacter sp.]MBO3708163.1 sensor histidine kinase [Candidatus Accumulibacter conexus]
MKPLTPPSIRTRLTRALLVSSVLWIVAVAAAVWLTVHDEVDELLDDTLQAAAEGLRGPLSQPLAVEPAAAAVTPAASGSGRFAWQVVDHLAAGEARTVAASALAPAAPLRRVPSGGFSDSDEWRVFGIPLADGRRWLYVAQTHAERQEALAETALSAALATLAIALLAQVWLQAQIRHELLPLQRLAQHLGGRDPEDIGAALGAAERSELQPVHAAIDELTRRLALRLARERAFTGHAAHSLRTPLAGIDAQLAVALRESPADLQPRLQRVRTAARRLHRVVSALLTLFRSSAAVHPQELDVAEMIPRLAVEGLAFEFPDRLRLTADADLLAAALLNLFDNSLRHGASRVRLSLLDRNVLRVHDDGTGVRPEQRESLQTALGGRVDASVGGLGLLLVDLVARAHGGSLQLPAVEHGFAADLHLSPLQPAA